MDSNSIGGTINILFKLNIFITQSHGVIGNTREFGSLVPGSSPGETTMHQNIATHETKDY